MNNIYHSATVKLTAWYIIIVMAISLIFSGVVYHFAMNELALGLDRQSQRIYNAYPVFDNNPFFRHASDLTNGSHHIILQLLKFNLAVLVAAGFASYWLARRTLRPIEASNERQKRFTADASHELRTPLTALRMETEVALLDNKASKSDLRTALESNLEETAKLDSLLNNLLRLSRLESDEIRHNFLPLFSDDIIKPAIAHVAKQADHKHITIKSKRSRQPLYGDTDSLIQLLVVLLDNAIKYSPERATVTVTTAAAANATRISVADHGIGIEPAALQHVFDRFYRQDAARTHGATEGYGLGLSIAKHIADVHHGTITIRSRLDRGTTVTVELPARPH